VTEAAPVIESTARAAGLATRDVIEIKAVGELDADCHALLHIVIAAMLGTGPVSVAFSRESNQRIDRGARTRGVGWFKRAPGSRLLGEHDAGEHRHHA